MAAREIEAETLEELADAEAVCTRCPLFRHATRVVPGEGTANARLMVVGEQPGDSEDLAGRPFVGPAGRILDEALEEAGIPREKVFVTNAVKHFNFEPRGKRRLYKRPNAHEIDRCRWWLDQERALVRPAVVVAMGATAVRGLLKKAATISSLRGRPLSLGDGTPLGVTIHPSYVLRLRDPGDRAREFDAFSADLQRYWRMAG